MNNNGGIRDPVHIGVFNGDNTGFIGGGGGHNNQGGNRNSVHISQEEVMNFFLGGRSMQMVARDFENLCKSKFGSNSEFGSNSGSGQIINGGNYENIPPSSGRPIKIQTINGGNHGSITGK